MAETEGGRYKGDGLGGPAERKKKSLRREEKNKKPEFSLRLPVCKRRPIASCGSAAAAVWAKKAPIALNHALVAT